MSAEKSIGTSLKKTSSTQFTVGNLTEIGEIGVTSTEIDVTTLDSTAGYKEFIASLKDAGELALKGMMKDDVSYEKMIILAENQTLETWEIDFPSGAKWVFTGFVKMWKEAANQVTGVRGFVGSIRISGQPIYTGANSISA